MTTTATTTVIAELARRVGVPVSSRMPSTPKPQAFIIVSRIGGGMEDWALRNPRFLVECYAHTELDAEALAETAYEAWVQMRSAKNPIHHHRHPHQVRRPRPEALPLPIHRRHAAPSPLTACPWCGSRGHHPAATPFPTFLI